MQHTIKTALALLLLLPGCPADNGGNGNADGGPGPAPIDAAPRVDAGPVTGTFACDSGRLIGGDGVVSRTTAVPPDDVDLPEHPAHPVFPWRGIAARPDTVYVTSGYEVRRVVQESANDHQLHTVAGANQAEGGAVQFRGGVACGDARFASLGALATMDDGSLIIVDSLSSAILRVTAPDDPAQCRVHYVSGTSDDMSRRGDENIDPETVPAGGALVGKTYPNPGNGDGDHRTARHYQPLFPAVIDDRVYVLERDYQATRARVVRRIELDAATSRARAVTTLARFDDVDSAQGLAASDGGLYLLAVEGANGAEGVIYEIDPGTGAVHEVVRAGKEAWMSPSSQALRLSGLTDCMGHLCAFAGNHVWSVNPQTAEMRVIAGAGNLDPRGMEFNVFGDSYDHLAAHAAEETALPVAISSGDTRGFLTGLAYDRGSSMLWFSAETTQSAYLLRFTGCATAE